MRNILQLIKRKKDIKHNTYNKDNEVEKEVENKEDSYSVYQTIYEVLGDEDLTVSVIDKLELLSIRIANSLYIEEKGISKIPVINFSQPEGYFDVVLMYNDNNQQKNNTKKYYDCAKEIISSYWEVDAKKEDIQHLAKIMEKYFEVETKKE